MKNLVLLITFLSTALLSFSQVSTTERDALIALYNATDGANWVDNTNWNTTEPVSTWYGVTVNNISGQDYVAQITLGNNNLNGSLPAEIGNFPELTTLSISFNEQLTGAIPTEIGNLSNLYLLDFWNNNLTGDIPSNMGNCSSLSIFSFEDNSLTGNIPESFANLSSLTALWVNGNQLSGEFPNILSNWPSLVYFSIGDANLSGSYNNFSGSLNFSNNPVMKFILIDNNNISSLNLQNGNNSIITNSTFNTTNNPNLTCIFVDDAEFSSTAWTNIDASTNFVETQEECNALGVKDLSFESNFSIYPNPTNDIINISTDRKVDIHEIIISNALGQVVEKTNTIENINIVDLPSGLYLLSIESTNGNKANYKIVKN